MSEKGLINKIEMYPKFKTVHSLHFVEQMNILVPSKSFLAVLRIEIPCGGVQQHAQMSAGWGGSSLIL